MTVSVSVTIGAAGSVCTSYLPGFSLGLTVTRISMNAVAEANLVMVRLSWWGGWKDNEDSRHHDSSSPPVVLAQALWCLSDRDKHVHAPTARGFGSRRYPAPKGAACFEPSRMGAYRRNRYEFH